jgi:hypothetical protein
MPLLTNYTDANQKVVDEERADEESLTYYFASTNTEVTVTRTVTISQYRYVGMTLAAAQSCKTAVNSPSTGVIAVVRRASAGGEYCVEVTETTKGAWA